MTSSREGTKEKSKVGGLMRRWGQKLFSSSGKQQDSHDISDARDLDSGMSVDICVTVKTDSANKRSCEVQRATANFACSLPPISPPGDNNKETLISTTVSPNEASDASQHGVALSPALSPRPRSQYQSSSVRDLAITTSMEEFASLAPPFLSPQGQPVRTSSPVPVPPPSLESNVLPPRGSASAMKTQLLMSPRSSPTNPHMVARHSTNLGRNIGPPMEGHVNVSPVHSPLLLAQSRSSRLLIKNSNSGPMDGLSSPAGHSNSPALMLALLNSSEVALSSSPSNNSASHAINGRKGLMASSVTSNNLSFAEPGASANPNSFTASYHSIKNAAAAHAATPDCPLSQAVIELKKSQHTLLHVSSTLPAAIEGLSSGWGLKDFTLDRKLYKGYASSVYKACSADTHHPVALKVYSLDSLSEFLTHQVYREVEVHRRIHHPHVVELHAVFREGRHLILVQEYARGGCLMRVLGKMGGRMAEAQAADLVMMPLMTALAALHAQGIIHRDIKPENILFTENWQLKLADFGVAIDLSAERAVTRTGTQAYMAPEVQRCPLKRTAACNKTDNELAYTTAVDVYSLGVLLYQLLVGLPPTLGPSKPAAKSPAPVPPSAPRPPSSSNPPAHRLSSPSLTITDAGPKRAPMPPQTASRLCMGSGTNGSTLRPGTASPAPSGPSLAFPSKLTMESRRFIEACLQTEPSSRPTIHELLQSPWIETMLGGR